MWFEPMIIISKLGEIKAANIVFLTIFLLAFFCSLFTIFKLFVYRNTLKNLHLTFLNIEKTLKHPLANRLIRMNFIATNSNNQNLAKALEIWKFKYNQIYNVELDILISQTKEHFALNSYSKKILFRVLSIKNFYRTRKLYKTSKNIYQKVNKIYAETQQVTNVEFLLRDYRIVLQKHINDLFDIVLKEQENNELNVDKKVIENYQETIFKKMIVCEYYIKIGNFKEAFNKLNLLSNNVIEYIKFLDDHYKITKFLEFNGILDSKLKEIKNKIQVESNQKNNQLIISQINLLEKQFVEKKQAVEKLLFHGKTNQAFLIVESLIKNTQNLDVILKYDQQVLSLFETNVKNIKTILLSFNTELIKTEELINFNSNLNNDISDIKVQFDQIKTSFDQILNEFNKSYEKISSNFIQLNSLLVDYVNYISNVLVELKKYYSQLVDIKTLLKNKQLVLRDLETKYDNIKTLLLTSQVVMKKYENIINWSNYKELINNKFLIMNFIHKNLELEANTYSTDYDALLILNQQLDNQLEQVEQLHLSIEQIIVINKIAQQVIIYIAKRLAYVSNNNVFLEIINKYQEKDYKKVINLAIHLIRKNQL
ncbi:hypothetical protein [Mycoplasma feriruminatoris]|uniref:Uncharacterized protein n=1 Tax=Mycoplasma feriruminatoris TaxID=1179777 RepID=A0AAX3TFM6_9MOLU|nr:hypothetical protein [Mycoplasma feriruminatoris]UKS54310.1 hypothetical protein D500_00666 [Mycoplasma feriruminatoris]WFQ92849.1 hypothetical protein MFERI14822_00641 [Mycoplasma feriruminatoris]WFQ96184.1 chromosome segregation ATPase [Mycoplasma feriruminatoris]VZK65488.1 hypothetical protein MF5292_00665 [Mycoplasma feriruminatoris]VZR75630.1 hypothetical protein MF5294_00662 [Mycoplasma feriruminatoris]